MIGRRYAFLALCGILGAAAAPGGWAGDAIPISAPNDTLMPAADAVESMAAWAASAFGGAPPGAAVSLRLIRQDFNTLHFGQSCMETPLTLGDVQFEHGLGTHANSEIVVDIPKGATHFRASAGIDNNYNTQGTRGSATFSVVVGDTAVVTTPVLHGGDAPYLIDVALPNDTTAITLIVDTTPDGPSHDQADWADAHFVATDGSKTYLDTGHYRGMMADTRAPFSFTYGGRSSADVLSGWTHEISSSDDDEATVYRACWTDPESKLRITADARVFRQYPAVDWVLHLENTATTDSPIIEDLQVLDAALVTGNTENPLWLHQIRGDNCSEASFQPSDTRIEMGNAVHMSPDGGRPSNGTFPFFDLEHNGRGLIAAIGWTGQWAATVAREQSGSSQLRAGMEQTRFLLHPGESVRTPRILLFTYTGDRTNAYNQFRRLMLFHYVPKIDGRPVALPIASQCFDRYSWTRPEWATEAGQIAAATFAHEVGFDTHWFDAAWFPGGFPNGVGNWFCKPEAFPRGLRPVTDAIHAMDMRFVLWFEPERVAKGTSIATEHPEFIHGGEAGGLFKLDDPVARAWLTELLVQRIDEFGLDIYRQDFNMDPLEFWRKNDAPDRQGITEIRYVEGLYSLWDTLRARFPKLLIDNCSSGGRRIDLETCIRAIPFWRSDTNCSPGHSDWNQAHTAGINRYVPLHMACSWTPDAYATRSAATAGLIAQWDYMNEAFPNDLAARALVEVKSTQKYWYGDFYPLVASGPVNDQWSVYQLHRADLDEGVVYLFRREASAYTAVDVALRGLVSEHMYDVTLIDDAFDSRTVPVAGTVLGDAWNVEMPSAGTSLLITYRPATASN